jgi:hypothetical protein
VRRVDSKSHTYPKLAGVTYAYTHTDTFRYTFCYDTTFTHTYPKLTWVTYAYTDGDCHSYRSAQGNPKASADSASSAVKIGKRLKG